jgi:hypothetical protein
VKICEDFALNFGDKRTAAASRQCIISFFLFTMEFLTKNITIMPHPPYLKKKKSSSLNILALNI